MENIRSRINQSVENRTALESMLTANYGVIELANAKQGKLQKEWIKSINAGTTTLGFVEWVAVMTECFSDKTINKVIDTKTDQPVMNRAGNSHE